jgi:hypothetical protein
MIMMRKLVVLLPVLLLKHCQDHLGKLPDPSNTTNLKTPDNQHHQQ